MSGDCTTTALAAKDSTYGIRSNRGDAGNALFAGPAPPTHSHGVPLEASYLPKDPATGTLYHETAEEADPASILFNGSILMPLHAGPRAIKPVLTPAAWNHIPDMTFLLPSPGKVALLTSQHGEAHSRLYELYDAEVQWR
jgi:hypothetical protein